MRGEKPIRLTAGHTLMRFTRFLTGLMVFAIVELALLCIHLLDWGLKYHGLGEIWKSSQMELPWISSVSLALAPIGWWSSLPALFLAIGAGCRARRKVRALDAFAMVCGTAVLWITVLGSITPFFKLISYMGVPAELVITPTQWAGNLSLLASSALWMICCIKDLRMKPGKSSIEESQ